MVRAVAIALVVQLGWVGWAEACDGCIAGWHAPADGATIPASTPALFSTVRGDLVTVRDQAGRLVPVTWETEYAQGFGGFTMRPMVPLAPGTYVMERPGGCPPPLGGAPLRTRFDVGPPAPLPKVAGTIVLDDPVEKRNFLASAGPACFSMIRASVVRVTLQPSPELVPFLPLARLCYVVDGQRWDCTLPGADPRAKPPFPEYSAPSDLYALCGAPSPGTALERKLSEGHHRGELLVHLPGVAEPLPPVPFEFHLSCLPEPPQSGGCSFGQTPAGPGAVLLVAAAVAAHLRRRRTRN